MARSQTTQKHERKRDWKLVRKLVENKSTNVRKREACRRLLVHYKSKLQSLHVWGRQMHRTITADTMATEAYTSAKCYFHKHIYRLLLEDSDHTSHSLYDVNDILQSRAKAESIWLFHAKTLANLLREPNHAQLYAQKTFKTWAKFVTVALDARARYEHIRRIEFPEDYTVKKIGNVEKKITEIERTLATV